MASGVLGLQFNRKFWIFFWGLFATCIIMSAYIWHDLTGLDRWQNVMVWVGAVSALLASLLIAFIGALVIAGRLEERYFCRRITELDQGVLDGIYSAVGDLSEVPPQAFRLGRTGQKSLENNVRITIPETKAGLPWSGEILEFSFADPEDIGSIRITVSKGGEGPATIHGERFAHVPVPRKRLKSGKERNSLQPDAYLRQSRTLRELLESAFPKSDPSNAFGFLTGTFGGLDGPYGDTNVMIGLYPDWVQTPEFPNCPDCKKRMRHLIEMSAQVLGGSPEGQIFVFGCISHPDRFEAVIQYS